jgi:hypothetical protein
MKKIIIYNSPDDDLDFKLASNGHKYINILQNLDQHLRSKIKYEDSKQVVDTETYQEIRDYLYDLCLNENIDMYDEAL